MSDIEKARQYYATYLQKCAIEDGENIRNPGPIERILSGGLDGHHGVKFALFMMETLK